MLGVTLMGEFVKLSSKGLHTGQAHEPMLSPFVDLHTENCANNCAIRWKCTFLPHTVDLLHYQLEPAYDWFLEPQYISSKTSEQSLFSI